jgi:GT2 family glycosyltransferase
MPADLPISAIVTAYRRIDQTIETIRRIRECIPPPAEILVHVDANEMDCARAIERAFPGMRVIVSAQNIGPGGGRNRLLASARHEFVASFDDDSYPQDTDFFRRATDLMRHNPEAALITATVMHRGEVECPPSDETIASASFGSGAVIFRRSAFLDAGGFVPLPVAYGMEEEDLALRLMDRDQRLLRSSWLRVFHDTDLGHHASAAITAASIANLALLAYLRYPKRYWPYAGLQVLNRIVWCWRAGRRAGIADGIAMCPRLIWRFRHQRQPVSVTAMRRRAQARLAALRDKSRGAWQSGAGRPDPDCEQTVPSA